MLRRCLAYWREVGDRAGEGRELNSLGVAERSMGNTEEARELYLGAVELARADGANDRLTSALSNLADVEASVDPRRALKIMEEVLALDEAAGDAWGIGTDRLNIAGIHLLAGDVDVASSQLLEHGSGILALGDAELSVEVVENLAHLCFLRGVAEAGARLIGCADQTRSSAALARTVHTAEEVTGYVQAARLELGADVWATAYADGGRLSLEDAFAEAREALGAAR